MKDINNSLKSWCATLERYVGDCSRISILLMLALSTPSFGATKKQITPVIATRASGAYSASTPPSYAVDKNVWSSWNSGGPPPQWIEFDLQYDRQVTMIKLLPEQSPAGATYHNVWGRTAAGEWVGLGIVGQYSRDMEWLTLNVSALKPVRYIAVETTGGPSWVAWREVEVYEGLKPRAAGDVVARDLAATGAGPIGHLGFWDGSQVFEVLNEAGVVQKNSYDNFISRSAAWDPVYTNIPSFSVRTCFGGTCNYMDRNIPTYDRVTNGSRLAMANRAQQIYLIGAEYSFFAWPTVAFPRMYDLYSRRYYPAQRGVYRCDTFVMDIFGFTNTPEGQYWMWPSGAYYPVERVIWNDPQSWKTNINLLFTSTTISPLTIYNRVKGF